MFLLNFLEKNKKYLKYVVFILAAVLIFSVLTRADMQTDASTYSLRALGYFDYMDTTVRQTTPAQWYDKLGQDTPSWTRLSFHDAPPLVFIIQFIFFKILGASTLAARLPFALAGFGSVILTYFIGKKLYNENFGLLASFILTVFNYQVWSSRVGYLEPIATFFILLTIFVFLKALENPKYFIHLGVVAGLMALTKYTSFFVFPVMLVYLAIKHRDIFKNKNLYIGLIITLLIFSPVIFYNIKMYQEFGHFDLQFAKLLGQDISAHWPSHSDSREGLSYANQAFSVFSFSNVSSLPFSLLLVASILYLVVSKIKNIKSDKNLFVFLLIVFLWLTFTFIGTAVRFLSILSPFVALAAAILLVDLFNFIKVKAPNFLTGFIILLVVVFGLEVFYSVNTNLLYKPFGEKGVHYSAERFENGGFNQLEKYLITQRGFNPGQINKLQNLDDLLIDPDVNIKGKDVYIYDPNLKWFSALWYMRRWGIYQGIVFVSAIDLNNQVPVDQWTGFFKEAGANSLTYIRGANKMVFDTQEGPNQIAASSLEKSFSKIGAEEVRVNNLNNELAFQLYKINL